MSSKSGYKWTKREIDFLKRNYQKLTHRELGEKLGRTKEAVRNKCYDLGLKKELQEKWTKKEVDFLKKNYREMTYKEMGKKLGRTRGAVGGECQCLGLKKRGKKIIFNKEPTSDLSYVLGTCHGDGCVSKRKNRRGHSVSLKVMDREFTVSFRNALKNIGLRPYRVSQDKRGYWQVSATSKDFYEWYYALSYPSIFNTLIAEGLEREYLKGFFESEGNFYRKGSIWSIRIYNCDRELLKFVEELINSLGFKTKINEQICRIGRRSVTEYYIRVLGGSKEIIRFLKEINPCIPRKSLEKVDFTDRRGLVRQERGWSEEEEEFMRKNYPKREMTAKKIGEILKRSTGSVCGKAHRMELNKFTIPSRCKRGS